MKPAMRILRLIGLTTLLMSAVAFAQDAETKSCVVGVDCESGKFGISAEDIAAHPQPNIRQVYADDALVFDRRYRRVTAATEFFDGPGGAVTEGLGAGFNFVTTNTEEGGWTRTANGKWLKAETLSTDVATSRFAGVHLPEEDLEYPVAWLLVHTRPSLTPGAEPNPEYPVKLRYTTVNLYDHVTVDGWYWYQIGVDEWVKQTQVAMVKPVERPADVNTDRWVSVDLYEQVMVAYEGTKPVYATLVASGMAEWPTNEGVFNVWGRYSRTVMAGAYGQPDFYYLQEVPWTMYFDNDIALHGAYWHDGFGYRRSHGCVNMSITDAKWLFDWSAPNADDPTITDETGLAVYVYSSGQYR